MVCATWNQSPLSNWGVRNDCANCFSNGLVGEALSSMWCHITDLAGATRGFDAVVAFEHEAHVNKAAQ